MRFCDKLAKERKNNNLSQEQLADAVGVSRQAVSKWESGQSYPDMEKIISMTKILNCTLEDLLDDGTIGKNKIETKINFSSYLNDLLKFITKSYNMFCSMTFKQKIKCLFELFTIFCILLFAATLISAVISYLILNWFTKIPMIGYEIKSILSTLVTLTLLILGIIIFIHLFKIRYLDYFITIEDQNVTEKTIEKVVDNEDKKYYHERPKEKIIIRDPKHSELSIFNLFLKAILFITKICTIIFIVPVIFMFVFMTFLAVLSIYHTVYSVTFLFVALVLLGAVLMCYDAIYFVYNFVFNREINFKKTFIIAIISLIIIGIFSGLTFASIISFDYKDNINDLKTNTKKEVIDVSEKTLIQPYYSNISYIIDNTKDKAEIQVTYLKDSNYKMVHDTVDEYDLYSIYSTGVEFNIIYKLLLKDIQNHIFREYNSENFVKVKVYVNEEDYKILTENSLSYRS